MFDFSHKDIQTRAVVTTARSTRNEKSAAESAKSRNASYETEFLLRPVTQESRDIVEVTGEIATRSIVNDSHDTMNVNVNLITLKMKKVSKRLKSQGVKSFVIAKKKEAIWVTGLPNKADKWDIRKIVRWATHRDIIDKAADQVCLTFDF